MAGYNDPNFAGVGWNAPAWMQPFGQRPAPAVDPTQTGNIPGPLSGQPAAPGGVLSGGGFGGLRAMLADPSVMWPIAAQLIGGRTPQESFSGALQTAGQAVPDMRRRAAMNAYLKAHSGLNLTPEEQQLLQSDPELGRAFIARQLTPKPPITVGWGDRVLDPNTLKPIDIGGDSGGSYSPTSTEGADSNAILRGQRDPAFRATPEYQLAYSRISKPQLVQSVVDGNTVTTPIKPDLRGILPPIYADQPAAPAGSADPSAAGAGSSGVEAGQPIVTGQAKPTEQIIRNRQLYHVTVPELAIVQKNFDELTKLGNQAAGAGGNATQFLASPGYQRAKNSVRTIVANYLYSTSGATANPGEVETQTSVLMPSPGEAPASVADKKARIQTMMEAMKIAADGGREAVPEELKAKAEGRTSGGAKEGDTATGPGGHKIVMKGGQWLDAQTGQPIQ